MKYGIFQINTNQNINSFTQENLYLTVCSYHVTYTFQSESTLFSCLNVKELLARNRRDIWSLSDCKWLSVRLQTKWLWVRVPLQSLRLYIPPWFEGKKKRSASSKFLQTSNFTTYLLLFTVGEVCNISNKYRPSSNIFLQETLYSSFISKNNCSSSLQIFFETSPFDHIFTICNSEWGL